MSKARTCHALLPVGAPAMLAGILAWLRQRSGSPAPGSSR